MEALGSIADGRVHLGEGGHAQVVSSTGERTYRVWVEPNGLRVYSDDNGTVYRGYVGYPIIAVLMLQGRLPMDKRVAEALKGIKWKVLNEKYKSYRVVERIVKSIARRRGVSPSEIDRVVADVMEELGKLRLELVREPPPS